jgi:hypothetical protein
MGLGVRRRTAISKARAAMQSAGTESTGITSNANEVIDAFFLERGAHLEKSIVRASVVGRLLGLVGDR